MNKASAKVRAFLSRIRLGEAVPLAGGGNGTMLYGGKHKATDFNATAIGRFVGQCQKQKSK